MLKPKALLYGNGSELMWALLPLLSRANFEIEVLAIHFFFKNKFVNNYEVVLSTEEIVKKLSTKNLDAYDLVIACDDEILRDILQSNLDEERKLKLLPINTVNAFKHIYSKIGLSIVLKEREIITPSFVVVNNISEAKKAAKILGYPLMVKLDSSSGGNGVFECNDNNDLGKLNNNIFNSQLLFQKKIIGKEFDISAFYQNTRLIDVSCSEVIKRTRKFGPACLRKYSQSSIDKDLFLKIEKLGKALDANGFCNISAIKCQETDKIYFIEADMRPTVWVDSTRFIGRDLALKISALINEGKVSEYEQEINYEYPLELLVPFIPRLPLIDFILNRYNSWDFISSHEILWITQTLIRKLEYVLWRINRIPTLTIRFFLPKKEIRKMLKSRLRKLFFVMLHIFLI